MLLNVTNANKDEIVPGGYSAPFTLNAETRAIAAWGTWNGANAQLEYSFGGSKWFSISGHAAMTADDIDTVALPRAKYRWHVTSIGASTDINLSVSE